MDPQYSQYIENSQIENSYAASGPTTQQFGDNSFYYGGYSSGYCGDTTGYYGDNTGYYGDTTGYSGDNSKTNDYTEAAWTLYRQLQQQYQVLTEWYNNTMASVVANPTEPE